MHLRWGSRTRIPSAKRLEAIFHEQLDSLWSAINRQIEVNKQTEKNIRTMTCPSNSLKELSSNIEIIDNLFDELNKDDLFKSEQCGLLIQAIDCVKQDHANLGVAIFEFFPSMIELSETVVYVNKIDCHTSTNSPCNDKLSAHNSSYSAGSHTVHTPPYSTSLAPSPSMRYGIPSADSHTPVSVHHLTSLKNKSIPAKALNPCLSIETPSQNLSRSRSSWSSQFLSSSSVRKAAAESAAKRAEIKSCMKAQKLDKVLKEKRRELEEKRRELEDMEEKTAKQKLQLELETEYEKETAFREVLEDSTPSLLMQPCAVRPFPANTPLVSPCREKKMEPAHSQKSESTSADMTQLAHAVASAIKEGNKEMKIEHVEMMKTVTSQMNMVHIPAAEL